LPLISRLKSWLKPLHRPALPGKGDRLAAAGVLPDRAPGSGRARAEALYLSQPAVTLQLQALERHGRGLLERVGRRLTLTREAELYELARPLVEGLDGLDGAFRNRLRGLMPRAACRRRQLDDPLPAAEDRRRVPRRASGGALSLHNVTGAGGLDLPPDAVDPVAGRCSTCPTTSATRRMPLRADADTPLTTAGAADLSCRTVAVG
jgi:hypothetical protein